jgi:hypothetical protein
MATEAHEKLREAIAIFSRLGAWRDIEQAERSLAALPAR